MLRPIHRLVGDDVHDEGMARRDELDPVLDRAGMGVEEDLEHEAARDWGKTRIVRSAPEDTLKHPPGRAWGFAATRPASRSRASSPTMLPR